MPLVACLETEITAAARPSFTSVSAKVASSAAIATSLAATIPSPPARTGPASLVTTGLGWATIARCIATTAGAVSAMPTVVASARSAPEQKTRPDDSINTTVASRSSAARCRPAIS